MTAIVFGESNADKLAKDSQTARQIVKEINEFGVNDRQRWLIIYNLALELEKVEELREVVGLVKELKPDIFLSSGNGEE